jgi:hypothetical protein
VGLGGWVVGGVGWWLVGFVVVKRTFRTIRTFRTNGG